MEVISLPDGWAPAPVSALVADRLRVVAAPESPRPADGQVLVRMQLSPVHPLDLIHCAGLVGGPRSSGCEGLGVIEHVGGGVTGLAVGDRVLVLAWPVLGSAREILDAGARISLWREHLLCSPDHVLRVPAGISNSDAAQLFINPVSAFGMTCDVLDLKEGEWLALSGASSNLGSYVNMLSAARGFMVVNIVRDAAQVEPLTRQGYRNLVVYDEANPAEAMGAVMRLTGGGAHGAIDTVGGKVSGLLLDCLLPFKTLISVGTSAGCGMDLRDVVTGGRLIMEGKVIQGFSVNKSWAASRTRERKLEVFAQVCDLFRRGALRGKVDRVIPFRDVREAVLRAGAAGSHVAGKVLLSSGT